MTERGTTGPQIHRTVADLRRALAAERTGGRRIALVPTMGALHEGHLSLVRKGFALADAVVVSIFVNPTQFAPHEDFDAYPRTEASDVDKLAAFGVGHVFAPSAREMYPDGFCTAVSLGGPALGLETDFRPHFFSGVAVVVAKLLLAVLPDVAVFGEKDYQQLLVIRQLVRDLNMPVEIVGAPTLRETDGLAMSSRNAYLDPQARRTAATLYATLADTAARLAADPGDLAALDDGCRRLEQAGFRVDYLALRDAATLAPLEAASDRPRRLLVAAWLGQTRLIDNIPA
ncbi:pantoate--beta-alanine ligase [Polymorphum gilvum]|uniref:Pantothenate synthetase n=1 Tax=Polymorphum gilvum (strain LMG 25793 / CGMCC 1.9160 / SL003B-26A1) TaxID=991905 RepID=F2IVW5_POLGS|nr:pantoate--beta-alanine ligase [Polymorphum gilvum]ADZ70247.1 Pantothenate synthetase 2 [Polymorphum gilvum SL003B-26A1]